MRRSALELQFLAQTRGTAAARGLVEEYAFAPPRRWRMDFAWPDCGVAVEIEGAVWTRGRHTRGAGFVRDVEKYNTAASLGWTVLRLTNRELDSGDGIKLAVDTILSRRAACALLVQRDRTP